MEDCPGLGYLLRMSTASRPSLFASLRRDSFLFALLGTLVLLLNTLQPLAASQMPEGGHLVICTALNAGGDAGASGDPSSGPLDDCPICLIGNACGTTALHKATPSPLAAFPAPAALAAQSLPRAAAEGPAELLVAPPPAIRAPPLPA